jgi:hypothetical protein
VNVLHDAAVDQAVQGLPYDRDEHRHMLDHIDEGSFC